MIETIRQQQQRICIQVDSLIHAEQLDTALWTFKQESFLAHDIYSTQSQSLAPILINCSTAHTCPNATVLVNLTNQIPPFYSQYDQLIELIDNASANREAGRERYRFYRQAGHVLTMQEMICQSRKR